MNFMPNDSVTKGNKLERAIEVIEKTIIQTNPSLKGSKFQIEPKKIIDKNGAGYEIDLYVETDQGFGYKSIFIFECKNWKKKVSRREITEFSEKIKISGAQKGFFIAKEYTEDAKSRAKEETERIELLYFEDNPLNVDELVTFEFVNKINKIKAIEVHEYGLKNTDKLHSQVIDFENSVVYYKEKEGKLKDLVSWLTEEIANEKVKNQNLDMVPGVKHNYETEKEFTFQRNELYLKDKVNREIEKIKIKVDFEMELVRPKIVSQIDVRTRGKFIEYEYVNTSTGAQIKFELVTLKKS